MSTEKPVYAIAPINVHGTLYQAGEEIECGRGARESLLRLGQATETPPGSIDEEDDDDDLDGTSLAELGLSKTAEKLLNKHGLHTVERLGEFLDGEKSLTELDGIKEPTALKIAERLDAFYGKGDDDPDV